MARKIIIEPSKVWGYFKAHTEELRESMHEIASNDEFGISVYVTDDGAEYHVNNVRKYNPLPQIVVEADGVMVYSEGTISERDCEKTVKDVYDKYLSEGVVSLLSSIKEPSSDDDVDFEEEETEWQEYLIDERELELDEAVQLFIEAVVDRVSYADLCEDEIIEDVKDHFLEYLARKWEFPIRRPMFLEDEDGVEFFEEYPYEHMIFDDEDNPIYE